MQLEQAILALEKSLGISVTIIDNQGIFHTPAGLAVFNYWRQSHKKNKMCEMGFCDKCIDHCRHQMNRVFEHDRSSRVETCWKGVTELVVPLCRGDMHLGMFYAGSWRPPDSLPQDELGEQFHNEFMELPVLTDDTAGNLLRIIEVFSKGIMSELEQVRELVVPHSARAEVIASFIRDNAVGGITLDDLAEKLRLSRSRTSFLLKKYFDCTFSDLIHRERINRARTLLVGTDDTVIEISHRLGYSDEYHFNKVFRRITGMPPGKFRTRYRKAVSDEFISQK